MLTFASMFAKTNVDLTLAASDTTDMEMLMLNHRTAPDLPVVRAVRMSMSIPLVWREVEWEEAWGAYCGRKKTGNTIVDGGVLSSFPIRLIAEPMPEIMGNTDPDPVGAAAWAAFSAARRVGSWLGSAKVGA